MWSVIGQDTLVQRIGNSLQSCNVGHAHLLTGPPHVGKMTLAMDLAAAVNCVERDNIKEGPCGRCQPCRRTRAGHNPDLLILVPGDDEKSANRVSIDQVRKAENFLSTTPVENSWKTLIIDQAETLSTGQGESANAILKTLEEPPPGVLIILLTTDEPAVAPTIRSRCRISALIPMAGPQLAQHLSKHMELAPETALMLAKIARGCFGRTVSPPPAPSIIHAHQEQMQEISQCSAAPLHERFRHAERMAKTFPDDREAVRQEIYRWQHWWRDVMLIQHDLERHIENAEHTACLRQQAQVTPAQEVVRFLRRSQETLEALKANVNPRLAIERMMLAVPEATQ